MKEPLTGEQISRRLQTIGVPDFAEEILNMLREERESCAELVTADIISSPWVTGGPFSMSMVDYLRSVSNRITLRSTEVHPLTPAAHAEETIERLRKENSELRASQYQVAKELVALAAKL